MMLRLLREMLKPVRNYFRDASYREALRVKAACRHKTKGTPVSVSIAGYTIQSNDASSLLHQYNEIFGAQSFGVAFEKEQPVIFCCGANIGLEIFFFKKDYPHCTIHAFEADPAIAKILQENVTNNALSDVHVYAAAVAATNGEISFEADGALGGKTGSGKQQIRAIRLADILAAQPQVDLLLIDIEGSEMDVLCDCESELKKVERLFVEWHGADNRAQDLQELLALLNKHGFRYRLNNKLPDAPFRNKIIESGFDAMVEIYAER